MNARWIGWCLLGLLLGARSILAAEVVRLPLSDAIGSATAAYWPGQPRRGDVVLVRGLPGEGPGLLLKRVVGLPGELVVLARDRLSIDGAVLDLGRPVVGSSPGRWQLGPAEYFVLSENLALGTDSRHTGPVRRADILGRAWLVYAPSVRRVRRTAPGTPPPR